MKVFICEQDVSKAKSMQAILGHYSYKVITFQRNTELFKQVDQHKPAVIIVNESFNENGGAETINRLRNNPSTSNIPVIFIGTDKINSAAESNPKAPFVEVVQEPVKIKNLKHYIDRWTTFRSLYIKH